MLPTYRPVFVLTGPSVAQIPESLVAAELVLPLRSSTHFLMATASGRGSVTSTAEMFSPARDLARSFLHLAER
eukprot:5947120-Heterocapsa_arctica.AAC.2